MVSPSLLLDQILTTTNVQNEDSDNNDDHKSICSHITQYAADLEQNMIIVMKGLEDPAKEN